MRIFVQVREKTLDISLGSGTQTIKWLAAVVSHRLKTEGILRKSFEDEYRTVVNFKDESGDILNPNESICNLASDKDTLIAEVVETLASDEFGNPILTDWMLSAYIKSSHGIRWYSEMEAYRRGEEQEEDEDENKSSSLLFVGELSGRDVDKAFMMDWQQMDWNWLGFSESDLEVRELKVLLKNKYALICKIFSHYCGVGRVGETYGMSLHEFGHLIQATGAINYRNHPRKIESIFASITDSDDQENSKSANLMSRVDFVYGLLKVALRNADDSLRNIVELIRNYLSGPVEDAWSHYLSQYNVYVITDKLMRKSIDDYFAPLKYLFMKYCTSSKNGDGMTYAPFKQLFIKTATIEPSQDSLTKTAFAGSMPGYILHRSVVFDFEELVFSEFIEAVCVLSKSAISDSTISDAQKIRLLFHSLSELLQPTF